MTSSHRPWLSVTLGFSLSDGGENCSAEAISVCVSCVCMYVCVCVFVDCFLFDRHFNVLFLIPPVAISLPYISPKFNSLKLTRYKNPTVLTD